MSFLYKFGIATGYLGSIKSLINPNPALRPQPKLPDFLQNGERFGVPSLLRLGFAIRAEGFKYYPRARRTLILRLLGPKTIINL